MCGQAWFAEKGRFPATEHRPNPRDPSFLSLTLWLLEDFLILDSHMLRRLEDAWRPPKPNKRRKRPNFILGLSDGVLFTDTHSQ